MLKSYHIYNPKITGSVFQEWEQCLETMSYDFRSGKRFIKLSIFINTEDFQSFISSHKMIGESLLFTFKGACPAFCVTVHPPGLPFKVSVEAAYISDSNQDINYNTFETTPYVTFKTEYGKEVWASGLGSGKFSLSTQKSARFAFNQMVEILKSEHMTMDNVVRQWNYIGNILKVENGYQNYQIFNEIRNEFYQRYRKVHGYPAATGIGMKLDGVVIDFYAIEADGSLRVNAIDNPRQINPYAYNQQVLKGLVFEGKLQNQAPQFERAMLLANNELSTIYVSGAASIIGQDTIGKDDVIQQTIVTMDNITKLTDKENISRFFDGSDNFPSKYSLLRVYIKRQKDFEVVKSVCNNYYSNVPISYIEADICREELLVEIEAENSSTKHFQ